MVNDSDMIMVDQGPVKWGSKENSESRRQLNSIMLLGHSQGENIKLTPAEPFIWSHVAL